MVSKTCCGSIYSYYTSELFWLKTRRRVPNVRDFWVFERRSERNDGGHDETTNLRTIKFILKTICTLLNINKGF